MDRKADERRKALADFIAAGKVERVPPAPARAGEPSIRYVTRPRWSGLWLERP